MSREDDPTIDVSGLKKKVEVLEHELKMCRAEIQKLQSQLSQRQQVENTDDYNEDLRQQVKKLSAELYAQQKQEREQTDAETQTDHHTWTETDYSRYDYGDYHCSETDAQVSEGNAVQISSAVDHKDVDLCQSSLAQGESKESGNLDSSNALQQQTDTSGSIADMLRATAEEALYHTGFVFDENSGMYYDHSTGFFYDSVNQLYYDANTGIYYYYDADSGKYQFHSRVELPSTQTLVQDHDTHDQTTADKKNRSKKSTISVFDYDDEELTGEGLVGSNCELDTWEAECQKRKKSTTSNCRQSSSKERGQKDKLAKKSSRKESLERSVKKKKCKKKRVEGEPHSEGTKRKHKKTHKEKKRHRNKSSQRHEDKRRSAAKDHSTDSELEEGEITTSEREESNSSTSSTSSTSSESHASPNTEEVAPEAWPPCVRVTVVRSPALQIGSLFILTADTAATIGREKDLDHAIRIPEAEVSKSHAEVYFDLEQQCYMLVDLGSQNGTVINGNRIFQPKVRCEPCPLSHGDEVRMGETVLSFHIHTGNDTCDGCEPGQIIAHLSRHRKEQNSGHLVGEDKEVQRQRELKQMKVKYGLKNSDFEGIKAVNNPKYKDRAKTRRGTVGSEGTFYRDDSPSSVHVEISEVNKGRKILEKMGWKKGEGLGKDGAGMKDPIQLQVRKAQSGLGSYTPMAVDNVPLSTTKNHEKWRKAQERFNETCQSPPLTCSPVKSKAFKPWIKGESTD